mgnify:CR=1 FL=1
MESAHSRLTPGHTDAHPAADGNRPAPPSPARGESGTAAGANHFIIASYIKSRGMAGDARQSGNGEQERKPVPVPPALLVGANLDVRV